MRITVIVQTHMDLFTLRPFVRRLRARGARFHFAVSGKVWGECGDLVREEDEVLDLDEISRSHRKMGVLLNFLRLVFTPADYSILYPKWNRNTFGRKFRALARIFSAVLPSWRPNRVNRHLGRLLRPFLYNSFPTERILNVTKLYAPQLLCAPGQKICTIMGSWDHPGKYPMGHPSDKVFVWNESLGEDWRTFQDEETEIVISYPVLHEYAIKARGLPPGELLEEKKGCIMYPATYSAWSAEQPYREELRLIEALCKVTAGSGNTFFIKPKPNSKPGEFDRFLQAWDHVEVGHYQNRGASSKFELSDAYNRKRLEELERCDLVVNLGTTFAVDAAAYGLPVVQLRLDRPEDFSALSRLNQSPHLARHYFMDDGEVYPISPRREPEEGLAFIGSREPERLERARRFSLRLRRWIMPSESLDEAADRVAEACLR